MNNNKLSFKMMLPIMLCFFVMGMVDIVGVSTNYIKSDFNLDDFTASFLPMMVFLWFAVFSIPTGMLMTKIGRKKTVLLSVMVHFLALALIYLFYDLSAIFLAFVLLGIGNTMLQVSLNPLVADFVTGKKLTSTLTFGQFVKAISSFLAPIIATQAIVRFGDWKWVFVIYGVVALVAFLSLSSVKIHEEVEEGMSGEMFKSVLKILKDKYIIQLFLAILLVVGVDVCMNTNAPQILITKLNLPLESASLGSSLYFGARTLGSFLGAFLLMKLRSGIFLKLNMLVAIVALLAIIFLDSSWVLYASIFIIGLTFANVFSIVYSCALQYLPQKANEVSSLMIMGVAGGAIITPIVGFLAGYIGMSTSFFVLVLCALYLTLLPIKTKE